MLVWPRLALLWLLPLGVAAEARSDGGFWLGDGSFRAHVAADAEGLREKYGPRFDPIRVDRVESGGVEFLGEEGLIDEFSSRWSPPPGYDGGFEGGFLKIGVGLLRRMRVTPYRFWDPYPVLLPATTELVERSALQAVFEQRLDAGRWRYLYRKKISVDSSGGRVEISYEFQNTGRERISFDQYNHNWLCMERGLPWVFATSLRPGIQWLRTARAVEGGMRFEKTPAAPLYFTAEQRDRPLLGWARCSDGRREVTVTALLPVSRLSIFVKDGFLAPEIFGVFRAESGESISWKRIYIFRTGLEGLPRKGKEQDQVFLPVLPSS
ncbi:hypothetical protein [Terrimicrobium sacchariphilum]|uniref:hypothetical protein n=1 Tax=Terrimicrobium sacchariphilum TaxID=690879 RepID=UPI001EDC760D|nr:hypothetical protein [Terrimicrobium sacchariphilum]